MVETWRRRKHASAAQRHRLSWRLVWHHAGLTVLSVLLCAAVFAALPSPDDTFRLSMATAYVGLAYLGATLLIGPIKVLRDKHGTMSDDLRRDIGIWAAILGVAHVVFGIQIHMGSPLLYFLYGQGQAPRWWPIPLRIDLFGLSNHAGLVATIIVLLLLLLSNDVSMRTLGNRWWKRLQQLNYVLLALVVVHGIIYQRIEERELSWVVLFGFLWLATVVLQLVGFRLRSSRAAARSRTSRLAPADPAESMR